MSKAWWIGCLVLALLTVSTLLCGGAEPPAAGEIERLIAQLDLVDTEVVLYTDAPPYYKYNYSPEMVRLIEIGKLAVPLLVQRLQGLREQEHVGEVPGQDIGDAIVAMLGEMGDPAATTAIVGYVRKWQRWEEAARGYGYYNWVHMEALGKVGRKLIGEPNGKERLQKLADFFEEVYYRGEPEDRLGLIEALSAIGEEEEARFYVIPLLVRITSESYGLTINPDPAFEAADVLWGWTGQEFGPDPWRWAEWFREKYPHVKWDLALPRDELEVLWDLRRPPLHREGVSESAIRVPIELKLPENPTKEQVREYVRPILQAWSRRPDRYSSGEPYYRLLLKVGPENVDVLLEEAGPLLEAAPLPSEGYHYSASDLDVHFVEFLEQVVTDEHKKMILDLLPDIPQLIDLVRWQGWLPDAKEVLVAKLRAHPDYLPSDWIEAVASFRDPETYEGLKAYFVNVSGRSPTSTYLIRCHTYELIHDLPGIDLGDAVAEAWEKAKREGEWEMVAMAQAAIEFGHIDALEYVVNDLISPRSKLRAYETHDIREVVLRHIDFRGTNEEIRSWFQANKERLVFDPATRKFRVRE